MSEYKPQLSMDSVTVDLGLFYDLCSCASNKVARKPIPPRLQESMKIARPGKPASKQERRDEVDR